MQTGMLSNNVSYHYAHTLAELPTNYNHLNTEGNKTSTQYASIIMLYQGVLFPYV
jgi:hypothetical protein